MNFKNEIIETVKKYKDIVPYAVFGVLTTIVNIGTYWIFTRLFFASVMNATLIAWLAGVGFAYATNRKYVFKSDKFLPREIFKEVFSFFSCRLATGIVDWLIMFVFVERIRFSDFYVKVFSNIVVILLNYAASKFLIFSKKKREPYEKNTTKEPN